MTFLLIHSFARQYYIGGLFGSLFIMAEISLDWNRAAHLILLVSLTFLFGRLLINRLGWGNMAAYGASCSIVCQISNVIMKLWMEDGLQENDKDKDETLSNNRAERRRAGGNPKKQKKREKPD
jgi:hypothetical protein